MKTDGLANMRESAVDRPLAPLSTGPYVSRFVETKGKQNSKIQEFAKALADAGYRSLVKVRGENTLRIVGTAETSQSLGDTSEAAAPHQRNQQPTSSEPCIKSCKARQSAKIAGIGAALAAAGVRALDEQAKVLGLGRSTAWTLLKA